MLYEFKYNDTTCGVYILPETKTLCSSVGSNTTSCTNYSRLSFLPLSLFFMDYHGKDTSNQSADDDYLRADS